MPEAEPAQPPEPTTVREVLAAGGTALAIGGAGSSGAITARQWRGHWVEGRLDVAVEGGEVALSLDRAGDVVLDAAHVELAPIELPEAVFAQPARLTALRLTLVDAAPHARPFWQGADHAEVTLVAALELTWSLELQGRITPLGPVTLRELPVALTIGGDAHDIVASAGVRADGTVWTWAGLVELRDLTLALAADGQP